MDHPNRAAQPCHMWKLTIEADRDPIRLEELEELGSLGGLFPISTAFIWHT